MPQEQGEARRPSQAKSRYAPAAWDGRRVRALRRHMRFSQGELAQELGTRQQTVSDWETGRYRPRGTSARVLSIVAERAGFQYQARSGSQAEGDR